MPHSLNFQRSGQSIASSSRIPQPYLTSDLNPLQSNERTRAVIALRPIKAPDPRGTFSDFGRISPNLAQIGYFPPRSFSFISVNPPVTALGLPIRNPAPTFRSFAQHGPTSDWLVSTLAQSSPCLCSAAPWHLAFQSRPCLTSNSDHFDFDLSAFKQTVNFSYQAVGSVSITDGHDAGDLPSVQALSDVPLRCPQFSSFYVIQTLRWTNPDYCKYAKSTLIQNLPDESTNEGTIFQKLHTAVSCSRNIHPQYNEHF